MGADENVEIVRRWFATTAEGDPGIEMWHPECVIENAEGWLIEVSYTGREGARRWWDEIAEAFVDFRLITLDEPVAIDDERVLTMQRFDARFRETGLEFGPPWWSIVTVRDGLLAHAVGFLTEQQARRAAGLEVEAGDEA